MGMGHGYLQLSLGSRLDTMVAFDTENVWNTDALDFDGLPDLIAHRPAFQLNWVMALLAKIIEYSLRTDGPHRDLLKKTGIRFEGVGVGYELPLSKSPGHQVHIR
jgi:hypothetical protein